MSDINRPARDNGKEDPETTKARKRMTEGTRSTDDVCHPSDKHERFDQAQAQAAENAENAGRSAAKSLLGGVLYGIGKEAGRELWELMTGSGA